MLFRGVKNQIKFKILNFFFWKIHFKVEKKKMKNDSKIFGMKRKGLVYDHLSYPGILWIIFLNFKLTLNRKQMKIFHKIQTVITWYYKY